MKQRIRWAASLLFVLASLLFSSSQTHSQRTPSVEQRVNSLLAQMTLEEKLGQLQQLSAGREAMRGVCAGTQLGFWNREMRYVVEPGEFRVMVGANSVDVIETKFQVN